MSAFPTNNFGPVFIPSSCGGVSFPADRQLNPVGPSSTSSTGKGGIRNTAWTRSSLYYGYEQALIDGYLHTRPCDRTVTK